MIQPLTRKRVSIGVLLTVLVVASSVSLATTATHRPSAQAATNTSPATMADHGWSSGRGNDRRTGATSDAGPTGPNVSDAWSAGLPGKPAASSAVVDGVVYVAVTTSSSYPASGRVIAYDATTGERLWNSTTLGAATGTVTVENGSVYVATRGTQNSETNRGGMYALDSETGDVRWHNPDASWGSPIAENGVVYLGDTAYYADTGEQKWDARYDVIGIVGGNIYAAGTTQNGTQVTELNADDGTVAWQSDVPGDESATQFTVTDDRLYYTADSESGRDHAYAVSTGTGDVVWQANLSTGTEVLAPAVSDGSMYVLTANERSNEETLYALDAETGAKRWTENATSTERFRTAPIVADGTVYVGGTKNVEVGDSQPAQPSVFALDGDSGERYWVHATEGGAYDAPYLAVNDGTLYLTIYESGSVQADGSVVALQSSSTDNSDDGTDDDFDDSNGDSDGDSGDCST